MPPHPIESPPVPEPLSETLPAGPVPPANPPNVAMRAAATEAAGLLRAIGSPYRLLILCLLIDREKTVSEIATAIGARQSLTSQHLTRLRLDGLVKSERRGHFAYYSLTDTVAKEIVAVLYRHYCAPAADDCRSKGHA